MPVATAPVLTCATADTVAKQAKLFAQLVRNEVAPSRDPGTCVLLQELRRIISSEHGTEGGPFAEYMNTIRSKSLSDLQFLAQELESLPVNWDGIERYRPMYFVLDKREGCWIPCYNAEDNRDTNGWITGGVRYEGGSAANLPAELGCWADCDADDNPSMPFVEW